MTSLPVCDVTSGLAEGSLGGMGEGQTDSAIVADCCLWDKDHTAHARRKFPTAFRKLPTGFQKLPTAFRKFPDGGLGRGLK